MTDLRVMPDKHDKYTFFQTQTFLHLICPHQAQVRQPEYACVEESGFLTKSQCFDLGNKSGSKCMYLNYKKQDAFGADTLSICAPCFVSGIGTWDCPKTGKYRKKKVFQ